MTSVSHPLISEIVPAPAKSRPQAPVRDEDKFVVDTHRPADKDRKDKDHDRPDNTADQIAAAPVQNTRPNATPNSPTDALPDTPAGNTAARAAAESTASAAATPPPQVSGATANGVSVNRNAAASAAATSPSGIPGQAQIVPTEEAGTTADSKTARIQPQQIATGNGNTAPGTAPLVSANPAQPTTGSTDDGVATARTNGQMNKSAVTPPPTSAQSTLAAQQAAAAQPNNQSSNRTTAAGSNGTVAEPDGRDGTRTRLSNAAGSSAQPSTISGGADGSATINVATTQPATAANTQAQPQNNSQILAQALASAAPEAGANPVPTPVSTTVSGDTPGVTQSFNAEMRAALDAPTQAAAYTARGAVTAQPATEQIAMQISRATDQGVDRLSVQLKPAELGKVTIDLEIGPDNRMLAVISAERSETLDLLQRDARSLEKALAEAGVKTDSGSLEFNLQGDGGAAENGRDGDEKLFDGAVMLPADGTDPNGTLTNTPYILPEGRLDIQV